MARPRPSRISGQKILADLRLAGRRGDRSALTIALESMRMLAHSPRYWEKYLVLLRNPFARLVDLLVIKQGEKIAHQKGWRTLGGGLRPPSDGRRAPHGALLPASPRRIAAAKAAARTAHLRRPVGLRCYLCSRLLIGYRPGRNVTAERLAEPGHSSRSFDAPRGRRPLEGALPRLLARRPSCLAKELEHLGVGLPR
jgi:hypothetical protein